MSCTCASPCTLCSRAPGRWPRYPWFDPGWRPPSARRADVGRLGVEVRTALTPGQQHEGDDPDDEGQPAGDEEHRAEGVPVRDDGVLEGSPARRGGRCRAL